MDCTDKSSRIAVRSTNLWIFSIYGMFLDLKVSALDICVVRGPCGTASDLLLLVNHSNDRPCILNTARNFKWLISPTPQSIQRVPEWFRIVWEAALSQILPTAGAVPRAQPYFACLSSGGWMAHFPVHSGHWTSLSPPMIDCSIWLSVMVDSKWVYMPVGVLTQLRGNNPFSVLILFSWYPHQQDYRAILSESSARGQRHSLRFSAYH